MGDYAKDEEEQFADDQGEQPYRREDALINRSVITTPLDAPVRTLLDDIEDKMLIVNPPFQRRSVWKADRQSRLIESLLLNIPIPVLYFAEDEDGTRVVVDGQQRLRAIEEFRAGLYKLQKLEVLPEFNGLRWTDLTQKQSERRQQAFQADPKTCGSARHTIPRSPAHLRDTFAGTWRPPEVRSASPRTQKHKAHPGPVLPLDTLDGPRHRRWDGRGPGVATLLTDERKATQGTSVVRPSSTVAVVHSRSRISIQHHNM